MVIPAYLTPHTVVVHTTQHTGLGTVTTDSDPLLSYVEYAEQFTRTLANQTAGIIARAYLEEGVPVKVGDEATLTQGTRSVRAKITKIDTFNHPSAPSHTVIYI